MRETLKLPGCSPIVAYSDITTEQWLELRKSGIGGSDAAAVMDLDQYSSPLSLVLEKTGRIKPDDISEKEAVKMGNILEPLIRDHIVKDFIAEKMAIKVEVIAPTHMYRSNEHPFLLVNPDGFLRLPGGRLAGLEIKTGNIHTLKGWGGKDGDEIPDAYYCQVQHYLAGTGLEEWWTIGLIGNNRLLRIVPRNDEFVGRMIEAERKLWDIIERNEPLLFPLPNGSDPDMAAIIALGSPQDESTVDMGALENLIARYQRMGWEIKEQEDERQRTKQEILIAMGTSRYGQSQKYRVTFSRFMRSKLDILRLKKENPALVESLTEYAEDGRLFVKEI